MSVTLPTREERIDANSTPFAIKAKDTREYYIQALSLVRSHLRSADDFMAARRIIEDIKAKGGYRILGYKSHQEMLEAEGISQMLKTAKAIIECKNSPGITMEELARRVGCSISLAARAVSEAGLKEPTVEQRIEQGHYQNGRLHIGGEKVGVKALARHLGCTPKAVREAIKKLERGKVSTSGKSPPSPKLLTAQKSYLALSDPEKCRFLEWVGGLPLPG